MPEPTGRRPSRTPKNPASGGDFQLAKTGDIKMAIDTQSTPLGDVRHLRTENRMSSGSGSALPLAGSSAGFASEGCPTSGSIL